MTSILISEVSKPLTPRLLLVWGCWICLFIIKIGKGNSRRHPSYLDAKRNPLSPQHVKADPSPSEDWTWLPWSHGNSSSWLLVPWHEEPDISRWYFQIFSDISLIFNDMFIAFPEGMCLLWVPGPLNPQSLHTDSCTDGKLGCYASTPWFLPVEILTTHNGCLFNMCITSRRTVLFLDNNVLMCTSSHLIYALSRPFHHSGIQQLLDGAVCVGPREPMVHCEPCTSFPVKWVTSFHGMVCQTPCYCISHSWAFI